MRCVVLLFFFFYWWLQVESWTLPVRLSVNRNVILYSANDDQLDATNSTMENDVKVFRKGNKKQKEYKIVDRRDSLPFAVQLQPSPSDTLRSTVYCSSNDGSEDEIPKILLGEFSLDASTTSGDTIGIGTQLYRVVRHRCLYQYQQKSFHMVRKILEVKELNRYKAEEYLQRQFSLSSPHPPPEEA